MAHKSFYSSVIKPAAGLACLAFALVASPAAEAKHGHPAKAKKSQINHKTPQQVEQKQSLRASVSMNGETGEILECNNCDEKRAPASLTKLMTGLIGFDALKSGKLHESQMLPLSDASDQGRLGAVTLARKGLRVGTPISVENLLSAIAVTSAADATETISTGICGTDSCIVDLMNAKLSVIFKENDDNLRKAKKEPKGLHTHFANPHGMPDAEQYTTAYDQAVIVQYMAKNYKDLATEYFSKTSYSLPQKRTPFNGHNKVLVNYKCKNALGLPYSCVEFSKTGYFSTPEPGGLPAKFCIAGSAAWNGYRVIAVTLGYGTDPTRNTEQVRLFDSAFTRLVRDNAKQTVSMPLHFPSLITPKVDPEPDSTNPNSDTSRNTVIPLPSPVAIAIPR